MLVPQLERRPCFVVADPLAVVLAPEVDPEGGSHVLCCVPKLTVGVAAAVRAWAGPSARLSALDGFELPAAFRVRNLYEPSHGDRSDRVRHALERLQRERGFDRIVFGVRGGLGLRAVQAKRAGLAFAGVELVARLDGCGAWDRDRAQRWPAGYAEVEADFAERHSFENADARLLPCPERAAFVGRLGWAARPAAAQPENDPAPLVTVAVAHYNLGRYLPETLASLAGQTYPNLEVLIVDDGSTDPGSRRVVAEMEARYPHFRFLHQANAGIGATRNRCLELAGGEYFVPMDADNVARPEMVERFVSAMRLNPGLAAMSCYFLAFEDAPGPPERFLYGCRPTGGPHALAAIRNVYGDATAAFRTAAFRAAGGYATDRGTSCEDWEAFARLVHAGGRVGVVPDHLFHYRQLADGFSRRTNAFANHGRVLREFARAPAVPAGEGEALWTALLGFHRRLEQLEGERTCMRYRVADAIHAAFVRLPGPLRWLKRAFVAAGKGLARVRARKPIGLDPPTSDLRSSAFRPGGAGTCAHHG